MIFCGQITDTGCTILAEGMHEYLLLPLWPTQALLLNAETVKPAQLALFYFYKNN